MASSIETPCVKLCKLENKVCVGCKRTLEEITAWSSLSSIQRQKIIKELDKR
jgi:hypothetical protein